MGKMNNSMLHFPSHLFVEMSLGNSGKWPFPDPRSPNFLGSMPPYNKARSELKIMFVCVHLKNLTLCPCMLNLLLGRHVEIISLTL